MCGRFEGKTTMIRAALLGAAFLLLYSAGREVSAQELPESVVRMIEQLCGDGEGDAEELTEYFETLMARPLDLGRADRETLESCPLFTPFMVVSLLEYRQEYGPVASEAELALVDGFGQAAVDMLRPFVTFGAEGKAPGRRRLSGKLTLRSRWDRKREDEAVEGMPVPLLVKFRMEAAGKFGAGFTLESDAGERGFPDFYSVYVSAHDLRLSRDGRYRLAAAVLGDYSLRFGQGLVLWNGFSMSGLSSVSSVVRRAQGVRPYASTDENDYFHGAGVTVAFPEGVEASVFYSCNRQDAKVEGGYFVSKPEDGLHDSEALRLARDALGETVLGANVAWTGTWLGLGLTAAAYKYDRMDGRRRSYYNSHLRYDGWWGNASVDFLLSLRGVRVFGEAALDRDLHAAVIAGAVLPLSDKVEASAVYRYYSKDYIATHAGAYCRSNVNNEHGVSAAVRWAASSDAVVSSAVEYTHFPYARFGVREASDAVKAWLDCDWRVSGPHSLYFKAGSTFDWGRDTRLFRLRADYRYVPESGVESSTRIEGCWSGGPGMLFYQQAAYRSPSGKFRCSIRATLFWTHGWDSRIYSYEGDVPGSFSSMAYYGKGAGLYVLFTYKPVRWFNVSFKGSASKYADSGRDRLGVRVQITVPF